MIAEQAYWLVSHVYGYNVKLKTFWSDEILEILTLNSFSHNRSYKLSEGFAYRMNNAAV